MADRDMLIVDNLHLVDEVVKRFKTANIGVNTLEDLYQEGCIGLIKAVDLGDPENPYFQSYLKTSIYNAMLRKIELTKKFSKEILPDVEYDEDGNEVVTGMPPAIYLKVEPNSASVYDKYLIEYLTERAKEVSGSVSKGIKFLILEAQGYSHGEIAQEYGIENKKCVSSYISRAKNYFRKDNEFVKLFGW